MTDEESCPHIDGCEMYGIFKLEGSLAVWKINYCNSDFKRCERFQRTERGEQVDPTLLPNGKNLQTFG